MISILGALGHLERAASAAYRLFLAEKGNPQAWLTLMHLVLGRGELQERQKKAWVVMAVGPDVAVDIRYDDGSTQFFIAEPEEISGN